MGAPEELVGGWTKGISIWVPHGGLSLIPDDPEDEPKAVTYLPEPEPGHAIGLHVVFARTDQGYVKTAEPFLCGRRLWIASGEVVLVLAQRKRMTDKDIAWLRENHGRAIAMLPEALFSDLTVRVSMYGQYDDAVRWIWDMGLELGL